MTRARDDRSADDDAELLSVGGAGLTPRERGGYGGHDPDFEVLAFPPARQQVPVSAVENVAGLAASDHVLAARQVGEVDDLAIRIYGDTAVVTGRTTPRGRTALGQPISGQYRYLRVWVKRQGRWQAVAFEGTRIAQP